MVATFARITTLLVATGILLIGHGLQLTLLPTHAEALRWPTSAIGLSGSFYFAGFVAGCIVIPSIVAGVGHIRTFMVMAAIATIALLGAALFVSLPAWIVLRFGTGFALSGLYMVIESWLNEVSPSEHRGTVLATYSVISLLGMALGQMLMFLGSPLELDLFLLGGILLSIAIVPVGLTRVISPEPPPSIRFAVRQLLRASPVAVVCSTFAGLVTGAFWALGPVMARRFDLQSADIGTMMGIGILGGAVAQLPIGRLSDRMDRRLVIGGLVTVGAAVALLGWFFAGEGRVYLFAVMFFLNAATMPVYALCIAHASDYSEFSLVEVVSGILIMHSTGSILGPIIVAGLMDAYGARSFFAYVLVCLTVVACWTFYRRLVVERPREYATHMLLLPRTTQGIAELPIDGEESAEGPEAPEEAGARAG